MDIPTHSLRLYESSPYPLNGNLSSEASRSNFYTTKSAKPSAATSTAPPSEATGSCSSFERTVRTSAKLDTPCTTPSSSSSPVFHGSICSLPPSKAENGVPVSTSKSSPRDITSVRQGGPVAATTADRSATHAACTPTSDDRLRDQTRLEPEEDRISFCTHSGVDSQGQKNSLTVDAQPEVHNSQGHIHNGNQPPVVCSLA